ncbi:hypothetical protein QYE76_059158 [Lolium multiflorum]|uniref:DNA-directed RNA polymerase N-terminal domain-containing protein n=1 Tax=Lolium multiflorum TaxID=4521 RepID=A0AAD8QJI3_LOLMU|nr:hypothetical protein QYE76_059158 [Lolium multiflorum]
MPLLLSPISTCAPPPRPRLRRLSPPPPMVAVAPPPRPATLLPSLSIGAPTLPPPPTPAIDGFDWLDLFAFLSSPADSHQIPHPDSAAAQAAAEAELEARRQVKAETEAWARAAEEYRALEREMLDRNLAPSLPYVKSLFLGWFEPLRDAVARDQDLQRRKRVKHIYAKYLLLLPAEKLAVIVMDKVMGLLMSSKDGCGSIRVVQAAHSIGEAVEREVS